MNNLMNMMKQARQMQQRMTEIKKEADKMEKTFTVGEEVKVVARGDNTIIRIAISPSAIDADDIESLEDLLVTAVNGALREIREETKKKMVEATGGMDLSQLGM